MIYTSHLLPTKDGGRLPEYSTSTTSRVVPASLESKAPTSHATVDTCVDVIVKSRSVESVGNSRVQTGGQLTIVGGGGDPPVAIFRAALAAAGGPTRARVVILPHASELGDTGAHYVGLWKAAGAQHVRYAGGPVTPDAGALRDALGEADLIWMAGGDQTRLMQGLKRDGVIDIIRARQREGAVVAGTSAGAAVMSGLMIVSDTDNAQGLGLWRGVLVDQHFSQRQRLPRLLRRIVLHPETIGIGIDERTAVHVRGHRAEVMGEGTVTIADLRAMRNNPAVAWLRRHPAALSLIPDGLLSAILQRGVRVVHAGETFSLPRGGIAVQ